MKELRQRKQIRLNNDDYSLNGYSFVTICSKNRENIFGEYIQNNPANWDTDEENINKNI